MTTFVASHAHTTGTRSLFAPGYRLISLPQPDLLKRGTAQFAQNIPSQALTVAAVI
ncbi:hypothetical protein [Sporomusa sp. KB1]|uniref:hypothetical protein n=1 Tax=Sporomusa sp. KB1 TaxID=943346 RepID=UPI001C96AE84|nr:hypothetical protein [Sporomusa sp. KB1]